MHWRSKQLWFQHRDLKIVKKKNWTENKKKQKRKKNDMWIERENKNKKFHKFDDRRRFFSSTKHNKKRELQKIMNESKKTHRVFQCKFYDKLKTLKIKIQIRICKLIKKNKNDFVKRAYNDNNDNENDSSFDAIENSNVENDEKKIAILFKKIINKIFKFKTIANIDVSFHMID